MADYFRIDGGHALSGTIAPMGNKNAALPLLAASLLTDEPLIIRNVPDIGDVRTKLAIARKHGRCRLARRQRMPSGRQRRARRQPRPSPLKPHPHRGVAGGPAARPLRAGRHRPAWRRPHRPPSPRHPPTRLAGPRRPHRNRTRPSSAGRRPPPRRHPLPRRNERHRHRTGPSSPQCWQKERPPSPTPRWSRMCRTSATASTRWAHESKALAPTTSPLKESPTSAAPTSPLAPTTWKWAP